MNKLFMVVTVIWIICISANYSYSAEYWVRAYGGTENDHAESIQQTCDGGYIVAGRTRSFEVGVYRIWVLKLNSSGSVEWQKMYGGDSTDSAYSVQQTGDGGYIVGGYTHSFGAGANDIWILKLDCSGNVDWQKTYGGVSYDKASSVQQTLDGGYIVAGHTDSDGVGSRGDIWILKLDSSGSADWQKTYGNVHTNDYYSMQQTSDGGYVVVGGSSYTSSAWVLKLDNNGTVEWHKIYSGDSPDSAYNASSVQQTSDGGYIVVGFTSSFGAGETIEMDIWTIKLDSSGNVEWQKTYGSPGSDGARSVQQTQEGGYIVAGSTTTSDDIWLLKLDNSGSAEWQKTYGGTRFDGAQSVQQTQEGGYIVAGSTLSFGGGFWDFWVLKLDSGGNIPECDIIGINDLFATDTIVVGTSYSITVSDTFATISDTSILPQETPGILSMICLDDGDGIIATEDNCPGTLNTNQEDNYPPGGNGIGDACECEGTFDCDDDQDGSDAFAFKEDFGRSPIGIPCEDGNPCKGDFDCDNDCDGTDAFCFKKDFGRSSFGNPCPVCAIMEWCVYDEMPFIDGYSNSGCLDNQYLAAAEDVYPWCGDDQIVAEVEENKILVTHLNATYNCCPDEIAVTLIIEGNKLKLTEEEILTTPCDCMCCYNVDTEIVVFEPGEYVIEVCWNDWETHIALCDLITVEVP